MQMIIQSPTDGQQMPAVVWNYEEVKAGVAASLAQYRDRAYTPDSIRGAKADRAALNKLKAAIATKRQEMKAQYLHPYEEFERQCKEIETMIGEVSGAIDAQIKAYEAEEAAKKKEAIEVYFGECVGALAPYVTLDSIWNARWLNKTYSMALIQEEIDRNIEIIGTSLQTIRSNCGEDADACIEEYIAKRYDLNAAMAKHQKLEAVRAAEQARRIAELKAKLNADAPHTPTPAAETPPAPRDDVHPVPAEPAPQAAPDPAIRDEPPLVTMDFRVVCTRPQLMALGTYMKQHGIRYGRVPAQKEEA